MGAEREVPPRATAGWVVAAIVAVVAVCAVSFMVSQRPEQAIAVAEGVPETRVAPPALQAAPRVASGGRAAITAPPADGADIGKFAIVPAPQRPATAFDANAAGSNASAIEPAH